MAKAKISASGANILKFIEDVKATRFASQFGQLSPEELAKVKQAYNEAKVAISRATAGNSTASRVTFPRVGRLGPIGYALVNVVFLPSSRMVTQLTSWP